MLNGKSSAAKEPPASPDLQVCARRGSTTSRASRRRK